MAVVLFLSGCLWHREVQLSTRPLAGTLYVTGNEPFAMLALQTDGGGVFKIQNDTTAIYHSLWKLQGQKVLLRCRPVDTKSDTASIIVERYELVKVP